MKTGDLDILVECVSARDGRTQPCHGFAQQSATTAHIEQAQPLERLDIARVPVEMGAGAVADIFEPGPG